MNDIDRERHGHTAYLYTRQDQGKRPPGVTLPWGKVTSLILWKTNPLEPVVRCIGSLDTLIGPHHRPLQQFKGKQNKLVEPAHPPVAPLKGITTLEGRGDRHTAIVLALL